MIERIEFYARYKMTPQHFVHRVKYCGGAFDKKCSDKEIHHLDLIGVEKGDHNTDKFLRFTDNGVEEIVDLRPHWERGTEGPIHCTRDGAMNVIRAVYAQTEKDLEELYAGGELSLIVEKNVGEKYSDYCRRKNAMYRKEVRKCEEFLGPVLSRYTMIKAYYVRNKMSVEQIAGIMGETPRHIANVIERLGLDRTETVKDGRVEYVDEEIIN